MKPGPKSNGGRGGTARRRRPWARWARLPYCNRNRAVPDRLLVRGKSGAGNPYPEDQGYARFRVAFKTLPSCDFTSQTGSDPAKGCGEVEADVDRIQGQKGANYDQRRDQTIFDCCDTGDVPNKSFEKDQHRQAPIGIQACAESDQKLDQILRTHWIFQTVPLATESSNRARGLIRVQYPCR